MRKLALKFGMVWFLIGAIPMGSIVNIILNPLGVAPETILNIQIPLIIIQLFGFLVTLFYTKEVFGFGN